MSLTTEQKIQVISECDEIMMAVKMLIATMEEAELKNHITLNYELFSEEYELSFKKLTK